MESTPALERAIQLLSSGDTQRGLGQLAIILRENPGQVEAWWWMAAYLPQPDRKRFCLQQILALQPDHSAARLALHKLDEPPPPPLPSSSDLPTRPVPTLPFVEPEPSRPPQPRSPVSLSELEQGDPFDQLQPAEPAQPVSDPGLSSEVDPSTSSLPWWLDLAVQHPDVPPPAPEKTPPFALADEPQPHLSPPPVDQFTDALDQLAASAVLEPLTPASAETAPASHAQFPADLDQLVPNPIPGPLTPVSAETAQPSPPPAARFTDALDQLAADAILEPLTPTSSQPQEPFPPAPSSSRARPKALLSRGQLFFLIFLLFALCALLALLLWWVRQDFFSLISPIPPQVVHAAEQATRAPATSYQLPFTWTPPPSSTPVLQQSLPAWTATPTPTPQLRLPINPPLIIGRSAGDHPLEVYRFGNGRVQRMIVAGIHGGYEWNTIALADELILYLSQHPEAIPADKTLYILRALNPDGEARAKDHTGHNNDHGVDLNRNWDAGWVADWERSNCWPYPATSGPTPNSEPETQALAKFLLARRVDALISIHSAALGIFPSGSPPYPQSLALAKALAAAGPYAYPPLETGCTYTGTLVDWVTLNTDAAAVDLELRTHEDTDFEINLKILQVFLNWP